jgi:membrane protease YdiL (CAAX protease family)
MNNKLSALVKRYPLLAYLASVAVLEMGAVLAAFRSPDLLPLLLSIPPALAALLLAAISDGRAGVKALLSGLTRWRIGLGGYALVLGLSLAGTLAIVLLAALLGSPGAFRFGPLVPVLLVFSLIFNGLEELGWRGFALPRLLQSRSFLPASLILGVFWGAAHLPLHLPGQWYAGLPVWPTIPILIAYSVLLSWIYIRTRGSVLATTLFHAMLNFWTPLTGGIDLNLSWVLRAAVFAVLALAVAVLSGRALSPKPGTQPESI